MANPVTYLGILPFDTDDDSVLFRSSLKSATSVTGATGTTGTVTDNGGITFDSELGVTTTATDNRCTFEDATLSLYPSSLQWEGQMSFEIECDALWPVTAGGENLDNATVGHCYFITWSDNTGGSSTPFGKVFRNTTGNDLATVTMNNSNALVVMPHSLGNDRFVRVTVSWLGSEQQIFIDGRLVREATLTNFPDMLKYLYVGADRGGATANEHAHGWYMRNLIVSAKSVQLAKHPKLINVGIVGDSFVTGGTPNLAAMSGLAWDKTIGATITGYFANKGLDVNITYYGNQGATITDGTGDDLQTEFANAVAANLDYAFVIGGLNDIQAAGWDDSTFDTDYRDHLNTSDGLMSVCDKCWVLTVTSLVGNTSEDTPAHRANRVEANTVIEALTDISGIEVIDMYTISGENRVGNLYWEGEKTGAYDDPHPSTVGHTLFGETMAKQLFDELFS